jgi:hypothetical protein
MERCSIRGIGSATASYGSIRTVHWYLKKKSLPFSGGKLFLPTEPTRRSVRWRFHSMPTPISPAQRPLMIGQNVPAPRRNPGGIGDGGITHVIAQIGLQPGF